MDRIYAKNVYYFYHLNYIGGTETFLYYLGKKYKDKDLMIIYQSADPCQLNRLEKYFNCVQFDQNMIYECENAFFNYNADIIKNVEAHKDYYLVLHADYKEMQNEGLIKKLPLNKKITKYIGVSKRVCDSWKEVSGKDAILCYNPFAPDDKVNDTIRLISATRLSKEKGKDRMYALANALHKAGVKFEWDVYTNNTINNPYLTKKEPTFNIMDSIRQSDFLIQLSDNEGYCYSVVEALSAGIPVITTPLPVLEEIGVDETNSITLNFDLSNIDDVVKQIQTKRFNFNYIPKEDGWEQLLAPGESQHQKILKSSFKVKCIFEFRDLQKTKDSGIRRKGEIWTVDYQRYKQLEKGAKGRKVIELLELIGKDENE